MNIAKILFSSPEICTQPRIEKKFPRGNTESQTAIILQLQKSKKGIAKKV
jgi:hypothetical protein